MENHVPPRTYSTKISGDPLAQKTMINMLAGGHTQKQVAEVLGAHPSSVSVWSRKENIREEIQRETERLLQAVPSAVEYTKQLIADGSKAKVHPHLVDYEIDDPDNPGKKKIVQVPADPKTVANGIKMRALGFEAATAVLTTAGIVASHSESRTVGMLLVSGDVDQLNPVIQAIVARILPNGDKGEEIDITPESSD